MLNPGAVLQNRYQIVRLLGAGGMGAVYLAFDLRLGNRHVVMKENRGGDVQQFQIEANILATLAHPGLPRVTDHLIEPGSRIQYLIMDFVEGENLDACLAQHGAFAENEVLSWFEQILDAVAYLHRNRIVHRDIKPANIIIASANRAVLVDFGLAKTYHAGTVTADGARGVTPGFSSPEQYHGGTDVRADIYSLGATLYALLTATIPPDAVDLAVGKKTLDRIDRINSAVRPSTVAAVYKAMTIQTAQRYQTVEEFRYALQRTAIVEPVTNLQSRSVVVAQPVVVPQPATRSTGSTWWLIGLGIIVGLICMISSVVVFALSDLSVPTLDVIATVSPIARADTVAPTERALLVLSATPTFTATPARTSTRIPTPVPTWTPTRDVAVIPSGAFVRGSTDADVATLVGMCRDYPYDQCNASGFTDESPQTRITVNAFVIDRFEVTNRQFAECVHSGGCSLPASRGSNSHPTYFGDAAFADFPVIWVTWNNALAYCQWRGMRLPTEAEWEKAARGEDGRAYPWGNAAGAQFANYRPPFTRPDIGDAVRVGNYPIGASPYGVMDMAGNVWEWVSDWYDKDYFRIAPLGNPTGPLSTGRRAIRGGSWNSYLPSIRTPSRAGGDPAIGYFDIGFRCASSTSP